MAKKFDLAAQLQELLPSGLQIDGYKLLYSTPDGRVRSTPKGNPLRLDPFESPVSLRSGHYRVAWYSKGKCVKKSESQRIVWKSASVEDQDVVNVNDTQVDTIMALDAEEREAAVAETKAKAAFAVHTLEWFKGFQEIMSKTAAAEFEARRKTIESLTQGAEALIDTQLKVMNKLKENTEALQTTPQGTAWDRVVEKGLPSIAAMYLETLRAIRGKPASAAMPFELAELTEEPDARVKKIYEFIGSMATDQRFEKLFSDQDAFQRFLRKARDLATETKPEPEK